MGFFSACYRNQNYIFVWPNILFSSKLLFTPSHLQVSPQEHMPIMNCIKGESSGTTILQAQGVRINGVKYMFLRMDPAMDAVLGRHQDSGCIIARTAQGMKGLGGEGKGGDWGGGLI